MDPSLVKIDAFIQKHHVMSLATSFDDAISVCSLFYAYESKTKTFVVASADDTTHIKHILNNPKIAGNIVLETKIIGKIQGVQFRGVFSKVQEDELQKLYFKTFPHAVVMKPDLWKIEVNYFKMTDNTLGFGKKLIWDASL